MSPWDLDEAARLRWRQQLRRDFVAAGVKQTALAAEIAAAEGDDASRESELSRFVNGDPGALRRWFDELPDRVARVARAIGVTVEALRARLANEPGGSAEAPFHPSFPELRAAEVAVVEPLAGPWGADAAAVIATLAQSGGAGSRVVRLEVVGPAGPRRDRAVAQLRAAAFDGGVELRIEVRDERPGSASITLARWSDLDTARLARALAAALSGRRVGAPSRLLSLAERLEGGATRFPALDGPEGALRLLAVTAERGAPRDGAQAVEWLAAGAWASWFEAGHPLRDRPGVGAWLMATVARHPARRPGTWALPASALAELWRSATSPGDADALFVAVEAAKTPGERRAAIGALRAAWVGAVPPALPTAIEVSGGEARALDVEGAAWLAALGVASGPAVPGPVADPAWRPIGDLLGHLGADPATLDAVVAGSWLPDAAIWRARWLSTVASSGSVDRAWADAACAVASGLGLGDDAAAVARLSSQVRAEVAGWDDVRDLADPALLDALEPVTAPPPSGALWPLAFGCARLSDVEAYSAWRGSDPAGAAAALRRRVGAGASMAVAIASGAAWFERAADGRLRRDALGRPILDAAAVVAWRDLPWATRASQAGASALEGEVARIVASALLDELPASVDEAAIAALAALVSRADGLPEPLAAALRGEGAVPPELAVQVAELAGQVDVLDEVVSEALARLRGRLMWLEGSVGWSGGHAELPAAPGPVLAALRAAVRRGALAAASLGALGRMDRLDALERALETPEISRDLAGDLGVLSGLAAAMLMPLVSIAAALPQDPGRPTGPGGPVAARARQEHLALGAPPLSPALAHTIAWIERLAGAPQAWTVDEVPPGLARWLARANREPVAVDGILREAGAWLLAARVRLGDPTPARWLRDGRCPPRMEAALWDAAEQHEDVLDALGQAPGPASWRLVELGVSRGRPWAITALGRADTPDALVVANAGRPELKSAVQRRLRRALSPRDAAGWADLARRFHGDERAWRSAVVNWAERDPAPLEGPELFALGPSGFEGGLGRLADSLALASEAGVSRLFTLAEAGRPERAGMWLRLLAPLLPASERASRVVAALRGRPPGSSVRTALLEPFARFAPIEAVIDGLERPESLGVGRQASAVRRELAVNLASRGVDLATVLPPPTDAAGLALWAELAPSALPAVFAAWREADPRAAVGAALRASDPTVRLLARP